MAMNKGELRELAAWGVRRKLADYERQLARIFEEFPECFLGNTPPQIVNLETKENGNGWPEVRMLPPAKVKHTGRFAEAARAARAAWTPERRAKQAATIAARKRRAHKAAHAVNGARVKFPPLQHPERHRLAYDYLAAHGETRLKDIQEAVGMSKNGNAYSLMLSMIGRGVAKKTAHGYALTGKPMGEDYK